MEDGKFGKLRDEAEALCDIMKCSGSMSAADFDENMLTRLSELGTAIAADEVRGGTLYLSALEWWGKRLLAVGRIPEAAKKYTEILRLGREKPFEQMFDVRKMEGRL